MSANKDIENCDGNSRHTDDISEPLIVHLKVTTDDRIAAGLKNGNGGSIWMVMISTLVAVCGSFEFGTCIGYSAPSQFGIMNDLGLSLSQYSVFGSIATIGAMVGAIASGSIADYIGRKGTMGLSSIFCVVGWLAVYFSKGVIALDLGRVCNGFGIGLIPIRYAPKPLHKQVPVFIAEIAPKTLRGALTTLNQLMIVTGISVTFIVGTLVSWRTLAAIGILPCFLLLVGLFIVPESPRWLAKVGRKKEFEFALRRLRGKDADISEEAAEIQEYIETIQDLPRVRVLDLLERRYLLSVTVGVGLMVFQQFGGINGINFYATNIFKSAGFPSNIGTIIFACIQIPFTFLGAILSDRVGRRPLLFFSASGMLIGCILLATCFYMKVRDSSSGFVAILALTGILTYIGTYSVGMGGVPWVMMSEIFPINVKGTAGSLVTLVNWFGSWAVSFTFNFLMSWSSCGPFVLYSVFNALAILFVAKIVPETKGRTLEEIQASMNT